jgi:hypothetical protein
MWAIIPLCIVAGLNVIAYTPERYAFVALPAWLILAASGCREVLKSAIGHQRLVGVAIVIALVAEAGARDIAYFRNNGDRRDWRAAFQHVDALAGADDIVVAPDRLFGRFFTQRQVVSWSDVTHTSVRTDGRSHWFILEEKRAPSQSWLEMSATFVRAYHAGNNRNPIRIHYLPAVMTDPADSVRNQYR